LCVCDRVHDHVNGARSRNYLPIVHVCRRITEAAPATVRKLGTALGKHCHEFYVVCVCVGWVKMARCDLVLEVPVIQLLNYC